MQIGLTRFSPFYNTYGMQESALKRDNKNVVILSFLNVVTIVLFLMIFPKLLREELLGLGYHFKVELLPVQQSESFIY